MFPLRPDDLMKRHPLASSASTGGRTYDAADPLDAPREHHVQEVHHGERHLELRRGPLGDLHLRQTALVPAVQQRGELLEPKFRLLATGKENASNLKGQFKEMREKNKKTRFLLTLCGSGAESISVVKGHCDCVIIV